MFVKQISVFMENRAEGLRKSPAFSPKTASTSGPRAGRHVGFRHPAIDRGPAERAVEILKREEFTVARTMSLPPK